jgi:putative transposase
MAEPISDDLRGRILEAYEAGAGSLRALSAQFRVSWGYSKKIRMQQVRSGELRRRPQQRHGPVSRMTAEVQQQMRNWVRAQPDLTEAELCEQLARIGVQASRSLVGRLLRRMGLRFKKNPSMRPNGTPRSTASGEKSFLPPSHPSRRRS